MLKINTLEGGVQTVDITPMTTIGELKCMLVDQRRCMGHKLVRAQILTDGMIAEDDKTLEFLGVLNGHFNLTVVYSKAEVEAATAKEICENEDVQVNIPAGVAIIKDLAFMSCNQVVIVNGSESVTEIRKAAFLSCKSLVHVDMSRSSLNFIDVSAFANCRSLESIDLPETLRFINASAFEDCKSLRNITIPQSVTSIASRAFKGCASLKSITMPIALKKDLSRFEAEVQGLVHYF